MFLCSLPMPKHHLATLLLLTLFAAGVRGLALTDSLWLDELHTSWVVSDSLSDIGPRARLGNQQPTYFYLPWLALELFGEHEWALRLPSYLAGIALIPACYFLARWWTESHVAACTVAALAALDGQWLFYAQEARVYALVQLMALVLFALFARVWQQPSARWRAAHVACAVSLFYLHYTTGLLVLAELVAWGIHFARQPNASYGWKRFAMDMGAYALLITPALPHVWRVAERRENWEQFVQQPGWHELLTLFPLTTYLLLPLAVAAIMLIICRIITHFTASRPHEVRRKSEPENQNVEGQCVKGRWPTSGLSATQRDRLLLTVAWLVIPLLIAYLTTTTDLARLYFSRYLIGSSAAALLIVAWCVASQRTIFARSVLVTVVLSVAVWSGGWLHPATYSHQLHIHGGEQWREAIVAIVHSIPADDRPILINAGFIESEAWSNSSDPLRRAYCSLPLRGMYRRGIDPARIVPYSGRETTEEIAQQTALKSGSVVWVLHRRGSNHLGLRVRSKQVFGSVILLEAEVP